MRISDWSSDVCSSDLRLLRPHNFPAGTPGRGSGVFETRRGKKVLVLNVMRALCMEDLDDPFACIAAELARHRLGATGDAAALDFHPEANSAKLAAGHSAAARAPPLAWSLPHRPTAAAQTIPGELGTTSRRERR